MLEPVFLIAIVSLFLNAAALFSCAQFSETVLADPKIGEAACNMNVNALPGFSRCSADHRFVVLVHGQQRALAVLEHGDAGLFVILVAQELCRAIEVVERVFGFA